MKNLDGLREVVDLWKKLLRESEEAVDLSELAEKEGDTRIQKELEEKYKSIEKEYKAHETDALLSEKYDRSDAVMLIHAGAGGTEAQDWAEMLLRMYLRYCERKGFKTKIAFKSPGDEAGIKSASVEIAGNYSYGYLKGEAGIHRLVRISPFDADKQRHTSFALVEVIPAIASGSEVEIDDKDLKIDTFRASGHGGQSVNKTSSAVRVTHLPTKIVIKCQNERSQLQNKETALKILRAKLFELRLKKEEEEKTKLRGEHVEASWGNQIRSYVLHPYQMIKDHRTKTEIKNTEKILNGDIDKFISSYLKWYNKTK